ncbi:hypothetical protein DSO57_1012485 [Entomophthora muscae]|uniref:Uncharacterized protein n=1 Tax=Entomophthora muscae TaxID=34485 RepID=A0ACC2SIQ8_9FUNG|nr:hypothetical protein DSO57_1012485 [Entomophthora muscae]
MVARLQKKDLINDNDARQSLRHSLLSQFPKLWAEFSGQVNGLNYLSEIVDQVYTLPNLQTQLPNTGLRAPHCTRCSTIPLKVPPWKNPTTRDLGMMDALPVRKRAMFLRNAPMSRCSNKCRIWQKRPGVNVVLQEEEPEDQEGSSGSDSEESKN